ncbi:hypothetical protein [Variovorax paradoxus]|uniref:hypothetical protein n=1 Tax=Variovorax paradoxus TaxID=34073 RepID=UPI00285BC971|nr:hypothetical protein [Variovorax paradoxus]MDR6453891.1 hypothetical protein [Variovorax paradoxus]
MQNPLINGGLSNFIALPIFGSVGIEVAIRLDAAWQFPGEPAKPIFAIGVSTVGTDPAFDRDGPGITITNDGYIVGMDNNHTDAENKVDTGAPMSSVDFTILRFEWSLTEVKMFRDGVEFFLPTPLDGMGDLVSGAWATFAFQAGGGGLPVCFLEYIDIDGTTQNLTPPFWTAFLGTHEVGEASDGPPDPVGGEPTAFTEITLPYSAAVPTGTNFLWYKVIVDTASTQRFTTLNSPNASADPYLALYNSTGAVLASNEDIDPDNANYLAQFDFAVTPGIYWLAIATFEGGSSGNWGLVSGGTLNTGLQLDISEAP